MKKITEYKSVIIEKFIYFIFGIYIITLFANSTSLYLQYDYVQKIVKLIRYGCYFVFAIKTVYLFIKEKNISILNLLFFIVGILVMILGKSTEILLMFLVVNSAKDLEFKKIAKLVLIIYTILFIAMIGLSYFDIVPNWIYYRQEIARYSFGFIYPTDLMSVYVTIVLLYFYIRNTKAHYIELAILEGIAIVLFKYTNGRLGLIMVTMIIALLVLNKILIATKILDKIKINSQKMKKIIGIVLKAIPIVLLIVTLLVSILFKYDIKIINWVNHIISQRISLNSSALDNYPIKLFGSNVTWIGWGGQYNSTLEQLNYNYVDMSYIRIIFDYGIIGTLFILYAYIKTIGYCIEKNEKLILMCLFIILIWGIIEPVIFSISRNIFIIYIGKVIASIDNKNNKLLLKNTRRNV